MNLDKAYAKAKEIRPKRKIAKTINIPGEQERASKIYKNANSINNKKVKKSVRFDLDKITSKRIT